MPSTLPRWFLVPILVGGGCLLLGGCGDSASPAPGSAFRPITTTASIPATRPFPPEYRILAKNLGMEMKSSPDLFRDDKQLPEILSEGHSAIMELRGIQSSDQQVIDIADCDTRPPMAGIHAR